MVQTRLSWKHTSGHNTRPIMESPFYLLVWGRDTSSDKQNPALSRIERNVTCCSQVHCASRCGEPAATRVTAGVLAFPSPLDPGRQGTTNGQVELGLPRQWQRIGHPGNLATLQV